VKRGTSRDHVEAVIGLQDRVLRNYWVTQTYADLSDGLRRLLAPDTANWCTFAVWASTTVGANMRGEALPGWLRDRVLLPDGLMGAIGQTKAAHGWHRVARVVDDLRPEHLMDVLRELLGEMAVNLSDGNTEVFAEIAPPAAAFLAAFSKSPVNVASARDAVLSACDGAPTFEGENHLRAGYSLWCDAMSETEPARRSQLILAGSLHLGVHEQHHLQPVIVSSMEMGVNASARRLGERIARAAALTAPARRDLDDALRPVTKAMAESWDDLMTQTLGTLQSPEGTLRLDRDVPQIPGRPFLSAELTPIVVDELARLRARFERSSGDGERSAARDWANFDERMNFIATLFFSRHHQRELFDSPLSATVREAIMADRLPVAGATLP
jgi:hypothetical protein